MQQEVEHPENETSSINPEEIRRHCIAHLSRNSPSTPVSSTDQVAENSLTVVNMSQSTSTTPVCAVSYNSLRSSSVSETLSTGTNSGNSLSIEISSFTASTNFVEELDNQQCVPTLHPPSSYPPPSPNKHQVIQVHRSCICKDMVRYFQDETVVTSSITFEIIDHHGRPEKGVGIGMACDVFSLFWKAFGDSMTIGERERVPFVRHDYFVSEWQAIGRILVQGYKMVSYFPMFLSRAFLAYCLFGNVPDLVVISSFKKYLSVDEEELVEHCISPDVAKLQNDEIIDFLEHFNCRSVLNESNCLKVITEIGKQELIQKPHIMLSTWQPILSELKVFEPFWSVDHLEAFYERIKPTNRKVLQLLLAQPTTDGERDALKFLQRYIRGLDSGNLGHFLRFTTGADILIVDNISVSFVKLDGIYKRPVAYTCGPVLQLPSTYQDFCELSEGFNSILGKSDWEIDIV